MKSVDDSGRRVSPCGLGDRAFARDLTDPARALVAPLADVRVALRLVSLTDLHGRRDLYLEAEGEALDRGDHHTAARAKAVWNAYIDEIDRREAFPRKGSS